MAIMASVQPESGKIIYHWIQLSASSSVLFFQRSLGSNCAKPAQIWSGWPGQVLAQWIRSRNKPVCKNHQACSWPKLPSWSRSDANRIRYVYCDHWLLLLCSTQTDDVRQRVTCPLKLFQLKERSLQPEKALDIWKMFIFFISSQYHNYLYFWELAALQYVFQKSNAVQCLTSILNLNALPTSIFHLSTCCDDTWLTGC